MSAEYGVSTQQISNIPYECRRPLHGTRVEVFTTDSQDSKDSKDSKDVDNIFF